MSNRIKHDESHSQIYLIRVWAELKRWLLRVGPERVRRILEREMNRDG